MTSPRAVVVPFGVSAPSRGLGLGLAALVHGFTFIDGQSVGLAQLFARPREDGASAAAPTLLGPVETFVLPASWHDLAGSGPGVPEVAIVITGAFEPPREGKGMLQLLAFDARDGSTRARVDAHLDSACAGATIVSAFEEVWDKVGGELGRVREIGDLGWEALESVLRAERCVLHDPERNGPHDRLAAMVHLGRAVGDAPLARFPAGRLAVVALEIVGSLAFDAKLVHAALRAIQRATEDAPNQLDLLEASAAIHARLGHAREAEAQASSALEQAPERARLYAILSEARRALGDLDGALDAVDAGLRKVRDDGLLVTERGIVLARRGDWSGAEAAWKQVLRHDAVYASAFVNLATLAAEKKDLPLAQALVDQALAAPGAHPEVVRRAVQLAVATEVDGIPRAARIAKLATALVGHVPGDAWAHLVMAQARVRLGEIPAALEGFARVMQLAPASALAAEAQRERLACSDSRASLEVEAVLRAAESAELEALDGIAARARSLGAAHGVWTAPFASGVAERRLTRWTAARVAFGEALTLASGATPAHIELVDVCLALGDSAAALSHAERATQLEGRSPRVLVVLARALSAAGRAREAVDVAREALAQSPAEATLLAIVQRGTDAKPTRPSFWEGLRRKMGA
jgi:tetratricopeptide (TPR) repeat protein